MKRYFTTHTQKPSKDEFYRSIQHRCQQPRVRRRHEEVQANEEHATEGNPTRGSPRRSKEPRRKTGCSYTPAPNKPDETRPILLQDTDQPEHDDRGTRGRV